MNPAAPVVERRRVVQPPPPPKVETASAATAGATPGPAARALARGLPGPVSGPGVAEEGPAKGRPIAPGEEVELAGGSPFAVAPEVVEWIAAQKRAGAGLRVRLGTMSRGTLLVHKTAAGIDTPDGDFQTLPVAHPALGGLAVDVKPVLRVRTEKGRVQGDLALRVGTQVFSGKKIGGWLEKASAALGFVGLTGLSLPITMNELVGSQLVVRSGTVGFGISKLLRGSGTFAIEGEALTFQAEAIGKVGSWAELKVPISRGADGFLTGSFAVAVSYKNFTGQLNAAFGHGLLDVQGHASYHTDKMSGTVTIVATDKESAKALTDNQIPEQVQAVGQQMIAPPAPPVVDGGVTDGAVAGGVAPAGPRPGERVVVGWGTLDVVMADWLTGKALVVVEPTGDVTIVGKLTPRMNKPLVEQQPEKSITLFTFSPRATYGIPVVGDIFVEASISLSAFARFGPVTLDNMSMGGLWSTNPERLKNFLLTGTLSASAVAGLRLTAEGKAGIEILDHDIAVGVGMKAEAGIKGYVSATPEIGYREIADVELGKRGEYFIGGHLEVAAQPYLGLEGYFFVEIKTPWWSPLSDKRWPWPIGSLEYALPGEFGIGADVEHVLGSGKVPEVKFGQVSFDADKFLTDLVDDHVPKKSGRDDRKQGSWREAPKPPDALPTAQAPAAGKAVGPDPSVSGKGKTPRAPVTPRPAKKAAPTPPTPPTRAPRPGAGAQTPGRGPAAADGGKLLSPEMQKRWEAALRDLRDLKIAAHKNPLNSDELAAALAELRQHHRFSALTARTQGDHWHLHAAMNPEGDIDVDKDATAPTAPADVPQQAAPAESPELVKVTPGRYTTALGHVLPSQSMDVMLSTIEQTGQNAAAALVKDPSFISACENGKWALAGTKFHAEAAIQGRRLAASLPVGYRMRFELTVQPGKGGSRLDILGEGPGMNLEVDWKTTGRSAFSYAARKEMTKHAAQTFANLGVSINQQLSKSWVDFVRPYLPNVKWP
jgi:hypothetical protein